MTKTSYHVFNLCAKYDYQYFCKLIWFVGKHVDLIIKTAKNNKGKVMRSFKNMFFVFEINIYNWSAVRKFH